jgi:hypothetical protein
MLIYEPKNSVEQGCIPNAFHIAKNLLEALEKTSVMFGYPTTTASK